MRACVCLMNLNCDIRLALITSVKLFVYSIHKLLYFLDFLFSPSNQISSSFDAIVVAVVIFQCSTYAYFYLKGDKLL